MKKTRVQKYTALTLAAGALIAGNPAIASAAPLAGATGVTAGTLSASNKTEVSTTAENTDTSYSTRAGVSATLSSMVVSSQAKAAADAEAAAQKEAQEAQAVAAAQAAEAAQYANLAVCNSTDYVNIRTAPDASSALAGILPAKAVCTVNSEDGDWYNITSGDVTGYIRKDLLTVGDEDLVKSTATRKATVNVSTLNVRSAASTDAGIVTLVGGTSEFPVTDESDPNWVKVSTDSGEGYVSRDCVSLSTSYTYAKSQAQIEAEQAAAEAAAQAEAAAKAAKAAKAASKKKSSSSSGSSSSTKTYSAAGSASGNAVVSYAAQFVGNPYVYGGSSLTNGTDCSGYVMSVYAAFGVSLPHNDAAMRSYGTAVSTSDMQPGDIVCYSGHVGIYAGNGQILNASTPSTGIKYSNVNYHPILTVRRIFN